MECLGIIIQKAHSLFEVADRTMAYVFPLELSGNLQNAYFHRWIWLGNIWTRQLIMAVLRFLGRFGGVFLAPNLGTGRFHRSGGAYADNTRDCSGEKRAGIECGPTFGCLGYLRVFLV